LSAGAVGAAALGLRPAWTAREKYPLLRLRLFAIRTFRAAVTGSFITRLGIGGLPFLLPLLYQIGLGYTAVQSGLLIMPQTLAAIGIQAVHPRLLNGWATGKCCSSTHGHRAR
jgi:hypothetical protein